jgi:hypothetical protein
VLNEKANRSFSGKPPDKYLQEHSVSQERLDEQAIPAGAYVLEKFEEFLRKRSEELAARATRFLKDLAK